ncbi:hypothetical protein [Halobaculum sp. EA56]|uniref:hypothetical protein n=1 Tax=Halobaculum sp. EA56 TaxID=3421648 RepID=UPI003EBDD753
MKQTYRDAWRTNDVTETLWDCGGDSIAILAPCGGDIEAGSDTVAGEAHKQLVRVELAPTTWMVHGFGEDAMTNYYRSPTSLKPDTYPMFATIAERRFQYAISFRVHDASTVKIGGRVHTGVQRALATELRERLSTTSVDTVDPATTDSGTKRANVVNWLTVDGEGGVEIKLPPIVAWRDWRDVAQAVAAVYFDIL